MPFVKPVMDNDLLAVGGWVDESALNQWAIAQPWQKEGKKHLDPAIETHRRGSRSDLSEPARPNRQPHHNRHSKSEHKLLDRPPRDAIKEVRATQMIQRQHPACFVKAEGGQRGNEATAKLLGRISRVERRWLKHASAYLPLDEHEGTESSNPLDGGTEH